MTWFLLRLEARNMTNAEPGAWFHPWKAEEPTGSCCQAPQDGGRARAAAEPQKKKRRRARACSWCRFPERLNMLLVLSEDHKEHLALLAKVEPPGKQVAANVPFQLRVTVPDGVCSCRLIT